MGRTPLSTSGHVAANPLPNSPYGTDGKGLVSPANDSGCRHLLGDGAHGWAVLLEEARQAGVPLPHPAIRRRSASVCLLCGAGCHSAEDGVIRGIGHARRLGRTGANGPMGDTRATYEGPMEVLSLTYRGRIKVVWKKGYTPMHC